MTTRLNESSYAFAQPLTASHPALGRRGLRRRARRGRCRVGGQGDDAVGAGAVGGDRGEDGGSLGGPAGGGGGLGGQRRRDGGRVGVGGQLGEQGRVGMDRRQLGC